MEKRKKCLVTGVAGFIGSNLAESLLRQGYLIKGIDCFLGNYDKKIKEKNIKKIINKKNFEFIEDDLLNCNIEKLVENVDYVFHLAGQPGVRDSWGKGFSSYLDNNILVTQRLLESLKGKPIIKLIYASSSSIYGDAETFPTSEKSVPRPISPYGVTKLAGEHLCRLFYTNFNVPTISLRFFTVYGPRQRPDLFFYKLIDAALNNKTIEVYGDGNQTRSFTFVSDIVNACILAMNSPSCGDVYNVGGGARVSVNRAIKIIEQITGKKINLIQVEAKSGDARHTCANISKARKILGYSPKYRIKKGLIEEVEWFKKR